LVSVLKFTVLAARIDLSYISTWVFLAVFLINSFLVYRGLVRAVVLDSYRSNSSSSYSALSVCTSTAILLDLAHMFLELEMTVHVLGNVVVSVLLLVVDLLRSGAYSHLVSLPLNVGLGDLESSIPIDDKLRHNYLSCLDSLLVWNLSLIYAFTLFLGRPHVHVGPGGDKGGGSVKLLDVAAEGVGDSVLLVVVGEGGGGDKLLVVGAKVSAAYSSSTLSSTQALFHLLDHTSECIAK
jgi:hypothetical protein